MAVISSYGSIEDKNYFFQQDIISRYISSDQELEKLFDYLLSASDSIWRGCEANFKLYNSFQRYWIKHNFHNGKKSPQDYFSHILKEASGWSRGIIAKNYNALGFKGNADFFVFSLLRHHNVPVPLLDFTRNPWIALFFALENTSNVSAENGIENYFSIYELTRKHVLCQPPFKEAALDSLEKGESYRIEFIKRKESWEKRGINYPEHLIRIEMCGEFIHSLATSHLLDNKELPIIIEDLPQDDVKFKIFSNLNIISQEGLFIASANPEKSLEECIDKYVHTLCQNRRVENRFDEIRNRQREEFRCFNIHKNLKSEIKWKLDKNFGINQDSVYPDLYKLQQFCEESFQS
jgi:hypothetical protein